MKLRDLVADLPHPALSGSLDAEINALSYDSRKVKPGTAFFALRGTKVDGHDFINTAIENGASAIIAETAPPTECTKPWVHIGNTRKALSLMAATFYDYPGRALNIAGVTGTNGKTTTTFLIRHLANAVLARCGMIGTVSYDLGDGIPHPATHTTPESLEVQQHLNAMRNNGCRAAAMEVSSHALDQDRVHGLPVKSAVFTNLTQDHLDYHETMERYFDAKTTLFEMAAATARSTLVINTDDLYGKRLAKQFENTGRVLSYGFNATANLRAENVRYDLTGTMFELTVGERKLLVRTPLIGDFNVYNALAALGAVKGLGLNLREAITNLRNAPQVPGRMERVADDVQKFSVFVDYAHTPDALENALKTLKLLRPRRIITVFGCGGDRDRSKRPLMARAVQDGSDVCLITSDNPRFENPAQIIADAVKGFTRKSYVEIPDRFEAIRSAIRNARPGDVVLIAGKGHENYQDINGVKYPFDDARVAHGELRALREVKAERLATRIQARQMADQEDEFRRQQHGWADDRPRRKWNE